MPTFLVVLLKALRSIICSRAQLQLENLAFRHQICVLQRSIKKRPRLRSGFRLFWTWKVRHGPSGRPAVAHEVRDLIRRMSQENPTWGAPRIRGELLKLGIDIGESSVTKYMLCCRKPPSQTWRTFLDNHLSQLVSIDFFTVPTMRFQVLYVFLVLAHDRRRILHLNVTPHPTAQ